jgi:GWxTD domain-containing protein
VRVPLDGAAPIRLRLTARVEGTSREWHTVFDFDPGAGSAVPWTFADFAWNVPDTGRDAGFLDAATDTLVMDVLLLRRPGATDHSATLHVIAGDGGGGELVLQRRPLGEAAGRDSLRLRLRVPGDAVPFGLVSMGLRLTAGEDGYLALVPERELINLRVGWHDDESWRRHAGWLEGLVGGDDRRTLGELPQPRRRAAWDSLWAARPADAHPTEREHLLRIVEADRRFGEFGRGALSDRGRIFVMQGPPDRTESRILDLSYPGEWEVWYYRRVGVLYRFYDAYGIGDYRLYDTAPY